MKKNECLICVCVLSTRELMAGTKSFFLVRCLSNRKSFVGFFHVILLSFTDAEKFCRKNVDTVLNNLDKHLVTAYTIQEKQAAREQIREKFGRDTLVKHQHY